MYNYNVKICTKASMCNLICSKLGMDDFHIWWPASSFSPFLFLMLHCRQAFSLWDLSALKAIHLWFKMEIKIGKKVQILFCYLTMVLYKSSKTRNVFKWIILTPSRNISINRITYCELYYYQRSHKGMNRKIVSDYLSQLQSRNIPLYFSVPPFVSIRYRNTTFKFYFIFLGATWHSIPSLYSPYWRAKSSFCG